MKSANTSVSSIAALNDATLGLFHLKTMLTAGLGFFSAAYDLFIIGYALALIRQEWHPDALMMGLIGSVSLLAVLFGAYLFGRIADIYGRRKIYGIEALLMVLGALGSACANDITTLIIFRFILGLGVGGDYPLSSVIMSEYANRDNRGLLVGLTFSFQALGVLIGPGIALALLAAQIDHDLAWRIMLGLGAFPALGAYWMRRSMPESPRWLNRATKAPNNADSSVTSPKPLRHYWRYLLGTAGAWFAFDYAYYGNTISTPMIMHALAPHGGLMANIAWSWIVFAIAAVPGYFLAAFTLDRIGHRRLQLIGFFCMGMAFLAIGVIPDIAGAFALFIALYAISYFFAEFGPNTTTFVLASEIYPAHLRTTAAGISAGTAKVGAFIGVFLFPILLQEMGIENTLLLTFLFSMTGLALTFLLPEPARQNLEKVAGEENLVERTFSASDGPNPEINPEGSGAEGKQQIAG
ncbi:MFS transporter [Acidithiobacillus thiooxidans]|uniref:Putative metabolite transport protein YaaU n=1 Tax=Acidithiobacillus thiooxidans ATCC 19377 TaxID=637390 RepID=A0A543Q873_ACITH|nr:MFS transporter [Acidithiobacillus thiooxidans]MDX5935969.1 MFS transporter [Acidithiobacillus thiooxidans]TQN52528.1 putative metabolite transport protein YaaU [Acidithiobacillus thiooxidans ATCC 19377]